MTCNAATLKSGIRRWPANQKEVAIMTDKKKSVFETLSAIDVSGHVAKKMDLNYLSWSWAWSTLKSAYPDTPVPKETLFQEMILTKDGFKLTDRKVPYLTTPTGTMVESTVTIEGNDYTEQLYVMDNRNRVVINPNQQQIDKTKKRCETKAIALAGLGLNLYAGEDLPMGDLNQQDQQREEAKKKQQQAMREIQKCQQEYGKAVNQIAQLSGQDVKAVSKIITGKLKSDREYQQMDQLGKAKKISEFAEKMLEETKKSQNQEAVANA